MQLPLFSIPSSWTPPDLSSLPSWEGARRVCLDCETRDPDLDELGTGAGRRPGSYVVGYGFAIEDGPSYYLPIRHEGGGNLDVGRVLEYVRDQAKVFAGDLVGAHLAYDLDFSASDGVEFKKVHRYRDVLVADPLIYELHNSYSLESVAQRWGLGGKDTTLLNQALANHGLKVNSRRDLWRLHSKYVGEYGEQDVRLPLAVCRRQERELEEQDLWRVWELESRLLPVLVKMRRRGVRVHQGRLDRIDSWALRQELDALAEIRRLCGYSLAVGDVNKAEVVAQLLQHLGHQVGKTPTGKPNVDKAVLKTANHPACDAILWARRVNKLRTTFVDSIRNHLTPDGRIHCTYNQVRRQRSEDEDRDEGDDDDMVGGRFGRVSCEHPNLQQQPSRDDHAPMWRAIYLPEEGEEWAACDYSQQEPRLVVHYACKSRHLIGHEAWLAAIEARDKYRNDPSTDNHQMMAEMAQVKRRVAKDIFLGLCYSMGGYKLCKQLGLPTRMVVRDPRSRAVLDVESPEGKALLAQGGRRWWAAGLEGQALLDKFDAAVPFVRRLAWAVENRARSVGYVMTLSGRRCHFPRDAAGNFDWTHKGLNRIIQGGSGDQMKQAMVDLDDAGYRILIQVHDENGMSVTSREEAARIAQVMRDSYPLEVPSKVDVEQGESWGGSMLDALREKVKDDKSREEYERAAACFAVLEAA